MSKKALIMWGGWDGHTPKDAAEIIACELRKSGFDVRMENSLAALDDAEYVKTLNLIVPVWTMGQISDQQLKNMLDAVRSGVGFGGFHGGAGDAFRGRLDYEWMVGGLFVGHPHVGEYTVKVKRKSNPIMKGMTAEFPYVSEQYYMLTDPGNKILATSTYKYDGNECEMPVVWTKTLGNGRVFYSALGHVAEEFRKYPEILAMTIRGMIWASKSKKVS